MPGPGRAEAQNVKTCIDSMEGIFTAVMNSRSAILKGRKQAITAERPSRLWLGERQDFIVHTDRSQLHLELLADVRPIHLWAGMNAGCQSPGSGNAGGVGDIVTKGNPSASFYRLLHSPVLP